MTVRNFLLGLVGLVNLAFFVCPSMGDDTERFEDAVLYTVSETNGKATLTFDGFRVAPLSENVIVSDAAGGEIDNLAKLTEAIGRAPSLENVPIGTVLGSELGDALYATVVTHGDEIVSVSISRRVERPLVGVSWVCADKTMTGGQKVISDALMHNGAKAYLIPQIVDESDCDEYLSKLEGFVMPGGTNFNPKWYGETPYPHGSAKIDDARDVNDVLATRWIIEHNVPGLWICRGEQCLNVALGGALFQDVPTYLATCAHNGGIPYEQTVPIPDDGSPGLTADDPTTPCMPPHYRVLAYGVNHRKGRHSLGSPEKPGIAASSKFLLPIIGQRYYPSVITSHHQAADPQRIGEGLTVVAYSPDGIVEALEYQANDFALGTQFHFEYDTTSDDPELRRFGSSFFNALLDHIHARK